MLFLAGALEQQPINECESLYPQVDIVGLEASKEEGVGTLTVSMGCVDGRSVEKHERILHKLAKTDEDLHDQTSHLVLGLCLGLQGEHVEQGVEKVRLLPEVVNT